jgi:hypothetical protein
VDLSARWPLANSGWPVRASELVAPGVRERGREAFACRIPNRCVQMHERGVYRGYKSAPAWSSRNLTAGMIERAMKRDERARPAPTVKCLKCEKLISPPERLVEHFSGCSGRRSSVPNRPGPMYRMPDGR